RFPWGVRGFLEQRRPPPALLGTRARPPAGLKRRRPVAIDQAWFPPRRSSGCTPADAPQDSRRGPFIPALSGKCPGAVAHHPAAVPGSVPRIRERETVHFEPAAHAFD